ncbi:Transmembrane domain-containing protein [Spironucleus salmonicida]|uniref:Transmembrane domain-containing protein n=1 Tax=Spironucleus salmonicida TaxID=348837 RepID=A0A9P8LL92_9EUKA|nr:Transmembrane domain-containing protein [Spironucleus salmonicida]
MVTKPIEICSLKFILPTNIQMSLSYILRLILNVFHNLSNVYYNKCSNITFLYSGYNINTIKYTSIYEQSQTDVHSLIHQTISYDLKYCLQQIILSTNENMRYKLSLPNFWQQAPLYCIKLLLVIQTIIIKIIYIQLSILQVNIMIITIQCNHLIMKSFIYIIIL